MIEGYTQIVIRLGIISLDLQRISIAGDRLVMSTQGIKGVAEIVMCLGIVRVYAEGFSTSDDFFFYTPNLS